MNKRLLFANNCSDCGKLLKEVVMNDQYSHGILRNYNSKEPDYQTPVKRLSPQKRDLVSSGLPVYFESIDSEVEGTIFLNDRGDLIVSYSKLNGVKLNDEKTIYLIDASDKIINKCQKITK